MSKTYQRIILIVAIAVCALAYGIRSGQQDTKPQNIDTTSRIMKLAIQNSEVRQIVQQDKKFWLITLERTANDPISTTQHQVMGGLGSQVLAMQLVLHERDGHTEWQQNAHSKYGNILQLFPPEAEVSTILSNLRACQQDCQSSSRFLYLIDPKDLTVRYYGERHWNVLALVQDIQNLLRS